MIVPKGWRIDTIGNICNVVRGGSPRPIQDYLTISSNGINWIKIGDVDPIAKFITRADEKITQDGALHSRKVNPGDFLLSNSMSFGRPYILTIEGCIHDGWIALQNYNETFELDFFYYVLCSSDIITQYSEKAAGSGVKNLNKGIVSTISVSIPSRPEQRAIAAALSDIDELVRSIENLITKKKNIKIAAMQELLTGKRRLPGFSGEWKETTIGTICDIISGGTPKTSVPDYWKGSIPWCTPTDITSCSGKYIYSTEKRITERGLTESSANMLPVGTLLLCSRATIGDIRIAQVDICTNQGFKSLIAHEEISNEWLYYYLLTQKSQMLEKAIGSTFLEISKKSLSELPLLLPYLKEQSTIASILSDMDREIESLEKKLAKHKDIKQGMMQELLTGRIRLIEPKQQSQKTEKAKLELVKPAEQKGHSIEFDEAVIISAIVNAFYSAQYPLGRKKVQKLFYLLRRYQDADVSKFDEKAAGPYNHDARYKGGERIAIKSKYINVSTGSKGSLFSKGENINKALEYGVNWGKTDDFQWLVNHFKYTGVDKLEVLATVDNTIVKLGGYEKTITLIEIKNYIQASEEWKAKLKRESFSDENIRLAMTECRKLFHKG